MLLPALKIPGSIRRHLAEYLAEAGDAVPWWIRKSAMQILRGFELPVQKWLAASAQAGGRDHGEEFIAGATPMRRGQTVLALRLRKLAFTADLLGEAVISEAEADWYPQTCLDMIQGLPATLGMPPKCRSSTAIRTARSLGSTCRSRSTLTAHFERSAEASIVSPGRLRPILRAARDAALYVHVDMEQYTHRALTYDLFCQVLEEPEFREWPDVGIVVQAYHPEAEGELRMLRNWVERRGAPITVRLVKGDTGTTRS